MSIDRFIMGFVGFVAFITTLLGIFVNQNFLYITLFVSFMLLQASITKFCPMAWIIKKLGGESKNFF